MLGSTFSISHSQPTEGNVCSNLLVVVSELYWLNLLDTIQSKGSDVLAGHSPQLVVLTFGSDATREDWLVHPAIRHVITEPNM